jgi:hypothetical protein
LAEITICNINGHRQQHRSFLALLRSIVSAPGEQHVRVDAVLARQFRYRDTRLTRSGCQPPLEFLAVVRPAFATAGNWYFL